jgi:hypothetical protein
MNTRHILVAVGTLTLIATTHCSSTYSTYCENDRNCSGGNDADVDACIEQQRTLENVSEAYDCGDQWDEVAECFEKATCKDKRMDLPSDCGPKVQAWSNCTKAASGKNSGKSSTSEETGGGGGGGNGTGASGGTGTGGNGNAESAAGAEP